MADQPDKRQTDVQRDDRQNPAGVTGKSEGGKIDSRTEKAQEEAAKDRAREGGYQ